MIYNFNGLGFGHIPEEKAQMPANPILVEREEESMINQVLDQSKQLLDYKYSKALVNEGLDDKFKSDVLGIQPGSKGKVLVDNSRAEQDYTDKTKNKAKHALYISSEVSLGKFFLRF